MDRSLVPANTKRSTLILGMFRPVPDLVILVSGTIITVLMFFIRLIFKLPYNTVFISNSK